MKTERRHELQQNELADWLGDFLIKMRPYGKTALGVLVLAAAGLFAFTYVGGRGRQNQQAAWSDFFDAADTAGPMNPSASENFERTAETYPGTLAAAWARQSMGDLRLKSGLQQMFTDRERAQKDLEEARASYERVLAEAQAPMLLQRAHFGLGQAFESLGDFAKAEENFRAIVQRWPDSPIARLANERLDVLKRDATKQWYAWFAEQKPAARPLSDPGLFRDLPNLPDSPDLSLPLPKAGELKGAASSTTLPPATNASDLGITPADNQVPATPSPNTGPLKLDLPEAAPTSGEPATTNREGVLVPPLDTPPSESAGEAGETLPDTSVPTDPSAKSSGTP
jgi:tetratricopeptide (TPR) repeat protein